MAITKIATVNASGSSGVIDLTSIPGTFTDLMIVCSLRSSAATDGSHIQLRLNNASTGYSFKHLRGNGSAASSYSESGEANINLYSTTDAGSNTSNTFSNNTIYIPNYAGSTAKSISVDSVYENNATSAFQHLHAALWTGTAAVTSVKLTEGQNANWVSGSTVTIYGVTKGSLAGVTVS